jgi:N-acetylmuramoyl-L-alanine amidase
MIMPISAQAAEIRDIRFGTHPDKTRMVIDFTGASDFQAKILGEPAQLQILLREKILPTQDSFDFKMPFQNIVFSKRKDLTALTLNLSSFHVIQSAFVIEGDISHRLVVDVVPANENRFYQKVNVPHGTLQTEDIADEVAMTPPLKPIKPIIMIDAGHGGIDPGAVSKGGIREKDITLSIAKKLAEALTATGHYDARLTRDRDQFLRLHHRVKMARDAQANLFLSIHADSVRGGYNVTGASIYTLSDTASDDQTKALMERENAADAIGGFDAGVEDVAVNAILIDLAMDDTMEKSRGLANKIIRGLRQAGVQTIVGPHRHAGFVVLKAPDIPSVLIETGFLSNEKQAQDLLNPDTQSKIVQGIVNAVNGYFD